MTVAIKLAALILLSGVMTLGAKAATTIPFISCPGEDGSGDIEVRPTEPGKPVTVDFDKSIAAQLAFYSGPEGPGIIGPVGWTCAWGASGYSGIYTITASPISVDLAPTRNLSSGGVLSPVVQFSISSADSGTGMFDTNAIAERFWPRYYDPKTYMTMGGENVASIYRIPFFPHDDYIPISAHFALYGGTVSFIKFSTPARQEGFGTWRNGLAKSDLPTDGLILFVQDPNYPSSGSLAVRLPPGMVKLKAAILGSFPGMLVNYLNQPAPKAGN